jgi:hypothetical protein
VTSVAGVRHRGVALDKVARVLHELCCHENYHLKGGLDNHCESDRKQKRRFKKRDVRGMGRQNIVGPGPRHEDGKRQHDQQIDVEILVIAHICAELIEQGDGEELDHRLKLNKFEGLK